MSGQGDYSPFGVHVRKFELRKFDNDPETGEPDKVSGPVEVIQFEDGLPVRKLQKDLFGVLRVVEEI